MRRLAELAVGQYGAVHRDQCEQVGLTARQRRRRVAGGVLEPVGVHALRSPFVESTPLADLAALVLDCGPGTMASGPTAAALHGFDGFVLAPPFHVTVPRGRYVERPPHVVHTTGDLPPVDRTRVQGVPVLSAARTLIDLARSVGRVRLTVALDSALRERRTTEDRLHARIVALRTKGRYGIPKLLEVIEGAEACRGGHSWLERRFLQICAAAGLPRPRTQQVATVAKGRLVRVDFEFDTTGVVVEVLGYRWHRGDRAALARDVERLNALVLAGKLPLQFSYDHVTAEPEWVTAQVRAALASRLCQPE